MVEKLQTTISISLSVGIMLIIATPFMIALRWEQFIHNFTDHPIIVLLKLAGFILAGFILGGLAGLVIDGLRYIVGESL